ncbi:Uncharacterized protein TCM_026237 [Theobroma cacao]|uniref:Secreted protein n=1 Tax=Theobroma cacao TaxID=3641 RepID=A0A061F2P4_THECC|nr:Uncharacterized protein TCM_026237 [Theobroma cacao]
MKTFQSFGAGCLMGFVLSSCCTTSSGDSRNANRRNLRGFHHRVGSSTSQEIPMTRCCRRCSLVSFPLGDFMTNLMTAAP